MQLFHFSEEAGLKRFEPRSVQVPSPRRVGQEWLNGPLVWAIDGWHQPMYLFPRDCPRILMWPTDSTTKEDRIKWWGERSCRMIACIEWGWLEALLTVCLYRYELPHNDFVSLDDAGMWVAQTAVEPMQREVIHHAPTALNACGVELRLMHSLRPLKAAWETSLHVSGIRLRNAVDWSE